MSKPVRGDSGYYDTVPSSEGEEEEEKAVEPSQQQQQRRSSICSVASTASTCSAHYYVNFPDLNDDDLHALDIAEQQPEPALDNSEEENPASLWRSGDAVNPSTSNLLVTSPSKHKLSDSSPSTPRKPLMDSTQLETPKYIRGPVKEGALHDRPPLVFIAPEEIYQGYSDIFNKYNLRWGVQWEIARLFSMHKIRYEDIPLDRLRELQGLSNADAAPRVEELLCPTDNSSAKDRARYQAAFQKELAAKSPWTELDKEEEALKGNPFGGLGCQTMHDDYYGGKIAFTLRLCEDSDNEQRYFLELGEAELGTSTRFTRRWGSCKILRVRIPKPIFRKKNNGLISYFKNDFVIHKRVFRAFYAREHSVFLLQLGTMFTLDALDALFDTFLQWHNPLQLNRNQSLAKWCTRMALGLSNSVPGLLIKKDKIYKLDDLYSPAGKTAISDGKKPESKHVMTDGAGFCTQTVLLHCKHKFNWETVPSAIQFRMCGSKGLFLLHPDDEKGRSDEPCQVWIRPSQQKILYDDTSLVEPTHFIIDVLRRTELKTPCRLSCELIVNLAQNAVPYEVFRDLMRLGLDTIAASLTQWSGPYAMENLWAVIAKINGSVVRSRLGREAGGSSRLMGFSSYDRGDDDDDDETEEDEAILEFVKSRSTRWWGDETSGCPSSLEETALVLLSSGFQPQSCAYLASALKKIFEKALKLYIDKYKIMVPKSAEAWIVPDPLGVLAAGEIFLKTSVPITGSDDIPTNHLLGDVLITRHPCRLPSDVQKVKAVWKDELRKYSDVIIFSVKGERSLASMLGGGDYDGDTGHVIWDPNIVNNFTPADPKYADPPPELHEAFEKDTITVEGFLREGKAPSSKGGNVDLMDYLLSALKDPSLAGQYSNYHDAAVYKHGYEDDEAWRLAYMFCEVLDSPKTGKRVKQDVLSGDTKKYNVGHLEWKNSIIPNKYGDPKPPQDNPLRRNITLEFIMDQLREDGGIQYNDHLAKFEAFLKNSRAQFKASLEVQSPGLFVEAALEMPWVQAKEKASLLSAQGYKQLEVELQKILNHVDHVRKRRDELVSHCHVSPSKKKKTFTEKPVEERQNILREVSLLFHSRPEPTEFLFLREDEVLTLKASCAYKTDTERHEKKWTQGDTFARFPFEVAMRELCGIKAKSLGPYRTITSGFYNVFQVTGSIQSFRKQDDAPYSYNV